MKAAVQYGYGSLDRVQVEDVERPSPRENEVLVRVGAAAVTLSDSMTRQGKPLLVRFFTGLRRPRKSILGTEFAGEVEAVGTGVRRFRVGDRVFGTTGNECGCYAEYLSVPEDGFLAVTPEQVTYEEAAPVCGALAAWNFLRGKARVQPGQKVLVSGASGSIGTAAVQLATYLGAEVTAVCSTENIELVESLGADHVVDYTEEDFTENGEAYDVIFDAESKSSFSRCKGSLTRDGVYLKTYPGPLILLQMLWTSRIGRKTAAFSATGLMPVAERLAFLEELKTLVDAGEVRSVVDRSFPLEQIADAYRHAERGHKRGTVVVTMEEGGGGQ